MNLQEVQVLLQSISSLAIAGGLIFTAVQFRTYRRSQHFANFSKLVELQMHLREMRVNDPTLAQVYKHDTEFANTPKEIREYFFNLMQLSVYEIVWIGHKHGQVPEGYFRAWDNRMREIAAETTFRRMMASSSMKIMDDEFQQYILSVVAKTAERP